MKQKSHHLIKHIFIKISFLSSLFFSTLLAIDENDKAHKNVNDLLNKYVKNGLVDYYEIKDKMNIINDYVNYAKKEIENSLDSTNNNIKTAYINMYNLLTIKLICERLPLKSIMDVKPRAWDIRVIKINEKDLTLDDIEHKILRKDWKDYRIHFALVCASIGCPDLPNQLLTAKNLEKELELLTTGYLNSAKGIRVEKARLYISELFNWFKGDFTPSVYDVLKKYNNRDIQLDKKYSFIEYDWGLNIKKIAQ